MIKKILKYCILALFVINLPTVILNNFGSTLGTISSYGSFILLIIYYIFFFVGRSPNMWMLYLGLAYFSISGLQIYLSADEKVWFVGFIKYLILMFFGHSFFRDVSKKEMVFFLLIGAFSVMANAFFIPSDYGRASGFYVNANPAGLACLYGYVLCYGLENKTLRQILQILFTLGGFVTFSRTFIIVWILVNLVSVKKSRKNIRIFALGIAAFVTLFILGELLNLGGKRFETFKATINNEKPRTKLDEDSRTNTWSHFYNNVLDAPFLGNGYGSFQGNGINNHGVHNLYLLIIGEAGIIPLVIFLMIFFRLTKRAWHNFKKDETLLYLAITLALYMMTLHDFFEYPFLLTLFLFWYNQSELVDQKHENLEKEVQSSQKPQLIE